MSVVSVILILALVFQSPTYVYKNATPKILFAPPAMIHDRESFMFSPIADIVESLDDWDDFFEEVRKYQNVVIVLNGPGGWVAVLEHVRLRIEALKAEGVHMKVVVTQFVASADALAICEFDEVEISPYAAVMFHMVATSTGLVQQDAQFKTCVDRGYLTAEELKKMNEGFEVWVTYDREGTRHVQYQPDGRLQPEEPEPAKTELEVTICVSTGCQSYPIQ
jgi:hypothetical protein